MDRIKADGHVNNRFVEENLAQNIAGTLMSAKWCNDVQEEIANVIEKSNLTLDPGNQSQLYEAIRSLYKPISDKIDALEKSLKYSRLDLRGSRLKLATKFFNYVTKEVRTNDVNNVPDVPFSTCNISVLRNAYEAIISCNQSFSSSELGFPEVGYQSGSGANLTTLVFIFKITGSLPELGEDESPTPAFNISAQNCKVAIDYYQSGTVNGTLATALQPMTGVADSTISIELLANRNFTVLLNCNNPFANYVKFPPTESVFIRLRGFRFEHRTILPDAMENRSLFPDANFLENAPSE